MGDNKAREMIGEVMYNLLAENGISVECVEDGRLKYITDEAAAYGACYYPLSPEKQSYEEILLCYQENWWMYSGDDYWEQYGNDGSPENRELLAKVKHLWETADYNTVNNEAVYSYLESTLGKEYAERLKLARECADKVESTFPVYFEWYVDNDNRSDAVCGIFIDGIQIARYAKDKDERGICKLEDISTDDFLRAVSEIEERVNAVIEKERTKDKGEER